MRFINFYLGLVLVLISGIVYFAIYPAESYLSYLIFIGSMVLFTGIPITRAYYHDYMKLKKEKAERVEAQLKLFGLQSQMNPHFIFNSLNSLQSTIMKDADAAIKFVQQFSVLIRMALEHSDQALISIEEEIDFLRKYIEVEKKRFDSPFQFNIDCKVPSHIKIPPLLTQPFVENAIRHGIILKEEQGIITVSIDANDEIITITIEDNGIGREEAIKRSSQVLKGQRNLGVSKTEERMDLLNLYYNLPPKKQPARLFSFSYTDINDNDRTGTIVTLTIPIL